MATDGEQPKAEVDPTLRALQRKIGEVISVLSLEMIDAEWLSGTVEGRAQKKHDLLIEAMRYAKMLEGKIKNEQ